MKQSIVRFLTVGLILGAVFSSAIPSLAYPETNKINTMEISAQEIGGADSCGGEFVLVGGKIIRIPPRAPSQISINQIVQVLTEG